MATKQVRDAGNLLTRAGFALPTVDVDEYTVRYPSGMLLSFQKLLQEDKLCIVNMHVCQIIIWNLLLTSIACSATVAAHHGL